MHRHPLVPVKLVVPIDEKWPVECHGMKLGAEAASYRAKYRRCTMNASDELVLSEIGFAFHNNDWKWEHKVQSAFVTYKEEHGDLHVTREFVIPSSAPWADETWGMNLGSTVHDIRAKGIYLSDDKPERREWLDEVGFVWDDLERRWEAAQTALTVYKEEHGDLNVPSRFVIPSSAPWAEETWGMNLGSIVNIIRNNGSFLSDVKPER
jgi:G3E family GTPase